MKRGGDHIQSKVHRADGLILTLPLQMRKVAVYPVDEVRDMIRKVRCNLCTLLLSSIGASALFLRFDLITVSVLVPSLPLSAFQLAVAVLVKSLLQTIEHRTYLLFSGIFHHANCPKNRTI